MMRKDVAAAVTAIVLCMGAMPSRATEVPPLDTDASCRAAERAAMVIGRTGDNCRRDENNAKDQLTRVWNVFSAADKRHCTALVTNGGPPSYVELLSCLEVSRDARQITRERAQRAAPAGETTAAGTAMRAQSR